MSKRRKTSPAEDLLEVVALMPWWAGVLLAVASYFLLHRWAGQPVAAPTQLNQLSTTIGQTLWRTLASFGQYILPLICLMGAAVSAWRRKERRQLVTEVAQGRSVDVLEGMNWRQFEKLVGEGFRLQGYRVTETGGGGADGGVDLVLMQGTEKFLVQCKQWRAFKVSVNIVRELYGVMAAQGAAGGFVVTSGRFTEEASAFAKGRNIQLMDGPQLHAMIKRVRSAAVAPASAAPETRIKTNTEVTRAAASSVDADAAQDPPTCPQCAKPMIRRMAKRGVNAGAMFWGCSGYPARRGTRAIG